MDKEKVIGARVYLQDGKIGLEFTGDMNKYEICYFLESFVKMQKKDYESQFEGGLDDIR